MTKREWDLLMEENAELHLKVEEQKRIIAEMKQVGIGRIKGSDGKHIEDYLWEVRRSLGDISRRIDMVAGQMTEDRIKRANGLYLT